MKNKHKELDVDVIGGLGPLTDKEQAAISEFIKNYKMKHAKKKTTVAKKSAATTARKRAFA